MSFRQDLRSQRFWRCVLAELLASLILVWVIVGSSVQGPGQGAGGVSGLVRVAAAGGLSVASLVQCFGDISGAQVNPAVTLAFLCTRKLDVLWSLAYVAAQCLGAVLGSGMVYLSLPVTSSPAQLVNTVSEDGNAGQALAMEVVATFQLVFTIFAVNEHRAGKGAETISGLAIGLSLTAGILASGTISGGSLNPARSFGPALVTGRWDHHWVYWIGPVLGAVLASVSFEFLFASSASREKLMACVTCKDLELVDTASASRSSLSTVTQSVLRGKQSAKVQDHS